MVRNCIERRSMCKKYESVQLFSAYFMTRDRYLLNSTKSVEFNRGWKATDFKDCSLIVEDLRHPHVSNSLKFHEGLTMIRVRGKQKEGR